MLSNLITQEWSKLSLNEPTRGYDKWESYLPVYEDIMRSVPYGSNYLELGVQNLGWIGTLDPHRRFVRAVGCDIDPRVEMCWENTRFTDIIIGHSCSSETVKTIKSLNLRFQLIVDDASHMQQDVLANFLAYFDLVADQGNFVIEDTHTDFVPMFSEPNEFETSIYEFFGSLASIGTMKELNRGLERESKAYTTMCKVLSRSECDRIIDSVQRIEFVNSCIHITKGKSSLGRRVIGGEYFPVVSRHILESFSIKSLTNLIPPVDSEGEAADPN